MKYNINKADPLAADYDENAADLAEGMWHSGSTETGMGRDF